MTAPAPNPQLDLFAPKTSADKVAWLICLLADGQWHSAKSALAAKGLPDTESNKRMVREAAELSEGQVISGQSGYKLTRHATKEEIDHFVNQFQSQAAKMVKRALNAQTVFFSRPRIINH